MDGRGGPGGGRGCRLGFPQPRWFPGRLVCHQLSRPWSPWWVCERNFHPSGEGGDGPFTPPVLVSPDLRVARSPLPGGRGHRPPCAPALRPHSAPSPVGAQRVFLTCTCLQEHVNSSFSSRGQRRALHRTQVPAVPACGGSSPSATDTSPATLTPSWGPRSGPVFYVSISIRSLTTLFI